MAETRLNHALHGIYNRNLELGVREIRRVNHLNNRLIRYIIHIL